MTEPNSSFSQSINGLQIAWDSTALGALKTCPRYYQYSMILGWVPRAESVHLTFGLLYHGALERFDHARAEGKSKDEAEIIAVRWALEQTWNKALKRGWISDDKNKNRFTLIRTIVWYLDQFRDDPIETIILANGKPAVELSFRFELGYSAPDNQPYKLCGHIDRLGRLQGDTWIVDRKTSKYTLDESYFKKFSPDNQFSTYSLATAVFYKSPTRGLIVDAAQIAVTFSKFIRGLVLRSEDQLTEWYEDTKDWINQAEGFAYRQRWPQNDKACGLYGGCQYREICSRSPVVRNQWLERGFVKRVWDPLQIRGDI